MIESSAKDSRLLSLYVGSTIILLSSVQLWRLLSPDSLYPHLKEDAIVENITAFLALLLSFSSLRRSLMAYRSGKSHTGWLFLAGIGILIAGEEITWGQEVFGFGHIEIFDIWADSLHDAPEVILKGFSLLYEKSRGASILFLLLLIGSCLFFWNRLHLSEKAKTLMHDINRAQKWLLLQAILYGFLSQVADSTILFPKASVDELLRRSFEEPLEMLSTLGFLFFSLTKGRTE